MPTKKTRKVDTAIIVAIIGVVGTIITALLASPIVPKIMNGNSTSTEVNPVNGKGALVFSNDFENGQISGFAFKYFEQGQWNLIKEKGNQVLELTNAPGESGIVDFGPNDFSDGVIEFRLNFRNFGGFVVNFRSEVGVQTYSLYFSPSTNEITLGYSNAENNWSLELFEGDSIRVFQFSEDVWYDLKLDVSGEDITVWVDDNKILTSKNSILTQGRMEFSILEEAKIWIDDLNVWEY